ncbi:putative ATPase, V1 complex, subunit C [Rosa chinensis]|uniref:V-type proton ATPase subunit C n=1 Tax=Rosa chinensis TaxID=74649 RepID=A0A2P6QER9_ROSCH|nr:putative ATPase, V1 complex, subunit C [Rosa chinensis]
MASRYWVVSLPVQNSTSYLWNHLQDQISKHSFDTPLYRVTSFQDLTTHSLPFLVCFVKYCFIILAVQYSQSLLSLSDDLLKSNNFVEAVSHKIKCQIKELERVSGVKSSSVTVDGVPMDSYLTRFV